MEEERKKVGREDKGGWEVVIGSIAVGVGVGVSDGGGLVLVLAGGREASSE